MARGGGGGGGDGAFLNGVNQEGNGVGDDVRGRRRRRARRRRRRRSRDGDDGSNPRVPEQPQQLVVERPPPPFTDFDVGYFTSYAHLGIHEEMIKDRVRTDTYRKAIFHHQDRIKGKVVVDVGCGTGILALFCAQAGARRVYAVDASDIAIKAQEVVEANNLSETVIVLHGRVEDVEIGEKVDVIVSEWMGYMLFYESMLGSVITARDRWLKPGGLILPSCATLYMAPFSYPERYGEAIDFWRNVYGIDMSAMMPLAKQCAFEEPSVETISPENVLTWQHVVKRVDCSTITVNELESISARFLFKSMMRAPFHGFAFWFDVEFGGPATQSSNENAQPASVQAPDYRVMDTSEVEAPDDRVTATSKGSVEAPDDRVMDTSERSIEAPDGRVMDTSEVEVPGDRVTDTSKGSVEAPDDRVVDTTERSIEAPDDRVMDTSEVEAPDDRVVDTTERSIEAPDDRVMDTSEVEAPDDQVTDTCKGSVEAPDDRVMDTSERSIEAPDDRVMDTTERSIEAPDDRVMDTSEVEAPDDRVVDTSERSVEAPDDRAMDTSERSVEAPDDRATDTSKGSVEAPDDRATDTSKGSVEAPDDRATDTSKGSVEAPDDRATDTSKGSVEAPDDRATDTSKGSVEAPEDRATDTSKGSVEALDDRAMDTSKKSVGAPDVRATDTTKRSIEAADDRDTNTSKRKKRGLVLSTSPEDPPTHWQQTLIYFFEPRELEQDQLIEGSVTLTQSQENARFMNIRIEYELDGRSFVKLSLMR